MPLAASEKQRKNAHRATLMVSSSEPAERASAERGPEAGPADRSFLLLAPPHLPNPPPQSQHLGLPEEAWLPRGSS